MDIPTARAAALHAEEAFEHELVRAYGQRKAVDARYRLRHDSAAVQAAAKAFRTASESLHAAFVEARRTTSTASHA